MRKEQLKQLKQLNNLKEIKEPSEWKESQRTAFAPAYDRPPEHMTTEQWDNIFAAMKELITPYAAPKRDFSCTYSKESGFWNEETQGTYHGCTNWRQYCLFINDVLNTIRNGQVDYCYYGYQIIDLYKIEGHRLIVKYHPDDRLWSVWLKSSKNE